MSAERFSELVSSPNPPLDLLMAAVASAEPTAPPAAELVHRLDQQAAQINGTDPDAIIVGTFGTLGFTGNAANYYDARNSLLHHVLERRLGIPLSLAVVAIELGRRHGVDLQAIGMPGHVLLAAGGAWFDPFAGGAALERADCERIFQAMHPGAPFSDAYLEPMTSTAIAGRTLENLRIATMGSGNLSMLVSILAMRADVPGAPIDHRMELARALAAVGRYDQAADQRDRLAELTPNRIEHHRSEAVRLRAHRN